MEDNRNADALEVLDVAIKRVERRVPVAISDKRKELLALGKGIEKGGVGVKAVGKMLNDLLDEALHEISSEAIKFAADREAAIAAFREPMLALVEAAQRHLDAYAYYVMGSLSAQSRQRITELLDDSRKAVGAALTVIRGGPAPVGVGDPVPAVTRQPVAAPQRRGSSPGPKPDKMAAALRPIFRQHHDRISSATSDRQRHSLVKSIWDSSTKTIGAAPAKNTVNRHWESYLADTAVRD